MRNGTFPCNLKKFKTDPEMADAVIGYECINTFKMETGWRDTIIDNVY